MVHIPILSLLGLQALLNPFASKEPTSTDAVPFVNPNLRGGSLLDWAPHTGGLGEPLNVIVSALSSPQVLTDSGFVHYVNAIGFGIECFGAHLGDPQSANLGDGHGWVNQTKELRQDYGNPDIGSCLESLLGGNHLRVFRQNGPLANTGALFLAVSEELNVHEGHNIAPNGYNLGRDQFVTGALGVKKYRGVKYQTVATQLTGLLPPGSKGVNHNLPTDGITTLITVTIVP